MGKSIIPLENAYLMKIQQNSVSQKLEIGMSAVYQWKQYFTLCIGLLISRKVIIKTGRGFFNCSADVQMRISSRIIQFMEILEMT